MMTFFFGSSHECVGQFRCIVVLKSLEERQKSYVLECSTLPYSLKQANRSDAFLDVVIARELTA